MRATLVSAGLALGVFAPVAPAVAQGALRLSTTRGPMGTPVDAHQSVTQCDTYRLRWDGVTGLVLGSDDGADGEATLTFAVPAAAPATYTVVATCQSSAGGQERVVGDVGFLVDPTVGPTSTLPPLPTTTAPGASTTRPAPTTTALRPSTTSAATTRPAGPTTTGPRPGAVTTPTTRPLPQDIAACERQAREAKSQLVYQPDRRMTVGLPYDVEVKLALDASVLPAAVIPGPDRTTIVQIRSGRCTIEAQLTGADFTVTPPEPRQQSFLDARVLTWRWQVSPKRTGPGLKLVLRLQPTVVEDGRAPRPGSNDFHEALIEVDAAPQSLINKVGDKTNGFLGNPLVKLLLIPSGGGLVSVWIAHRYRRRAREQAG